MKGKFLLLETGTSTRGNFGIRMALGGLTSEGARMLFDVTEDSDKPESSNISITKKLYHKFLKLARKKKLYFSIKNC